MVSTTKCILAMAVLIGLVCSGYAIKCYQCESLSNPNCGLKFEADDRMLTDCSRMSAPRYLLNYSGVRNATGCMKKTLESVVGHPQIVRTCYFGDVYNTQTGCQSDPSLPFVRQLSCDVCTKDECNSSGSIGPIAGIIMLFFGLARVLS